MPLQFDLYNDHLVLTTLREQLLYIRIWGNLKEGIKPTFTKTADSFDVIAKLFSLVTRQRENPNDETLQGA